MLPLIIITDTTLHKGLSKLAHFVTIYIIVKDVTKVILPNEYNLCFVMNKIYKTL
jgi:hypothetical protein